MNVNKLRLKWKIFAFLVGFCALLLVVLWLFQTVFLDTFYKRIKVMEIRQTASEIANNVESKNIGELIREVSDRNDIAIDIVDLGGKSLLYNYESFEMRRPEEIAVLIAMAREKNGEIYDYLSLSASSMRFNAIGETRTNNRMSGGIRPSMEYLVYVKMANNRLGEEIAVVIRAIISPVNATVTTLRYQLYFISCIVLFLAVFLAIIIAKRISKPIEEISQSAMKLGKGNYDTRFNGKGFLEIVALSDTLNTAAVELSRVEGLRRELLANVSHDLRTPLALIYSYAELMHDFPTEITSDQTQALMDETQRLTTLVNDALDISKLESEMEILNRSQYNFTQSVSEMTERTMELLKNEEFEILFSHDREVYVDADKAKIDRVFHNMLINAINYSGESRHISIEQTITNNHVRISVIDRGEGINEADLPFIWDRYYKSGKSHKRALTGSGLGLSIVKKIIESHNGKYGVTSEIGKGSIFWFEIETIE